MSCCYCICFFQCPIMSNVRASCSRYVCQSRDQSSVVVAALFFRPVPASRLKDAIAELRKALAASPALPPVREEDNKRPGRVQITVDVLELGPIELEVCWNLPTSVVHVHAMTGLGGAGSRVGLAACVIYSRTLGPILLVFCFLSSSSAARTKT